MSLWYIRKRSFMFMMQSTFLIKTKLTIIFVNSLPSCACSSRANAMKLKKHMVMFEQTVIGKKFENALLTEQNQCDAYTNLTYTNYKQNRLHTTEKIV